MAQRGYKTWCEKMASQYRKKLGIDESAPLCAWKLAKHLGVSVCTPEEIHEISQDVLDQLLYEDKSSWSAVTLTHRGSILIILNSSHSKGRQSNDLMHELSHIICSHPPARVDISDEGFFILHSYDSEKEEEADLLAATLLLPRIALVVVKKKGISTEKAAEDFNVSTKLLKMRLNLTGVNKQFRRIG